MDLTALMRSTLKPAALDGGGATGGRLATWKLSRSGGNHLEGPRAEARTNDRPPFNLRKGKLGGNKREGGGWVGGGWLRAAGEISETDFTSENIGKSQVMNVPAEELRTHQ